jgi:DNA-binding CsgD family transcriptional regulator
MDKQKLVQSKFDTASRSIRIENGYVPATLTKQWRSILSADEVDSLCQPLKQYDISYFLYVKRYKDGSQLEITSHPHWSEYYYKHEYYNIGPFKNTTHLYDNGKYFWIGRGQAFEKMYKVARESFDIDHGYTLVKKYLDCNEFFHFAGSVKNNELLNFYLNNSDVLERFILYFKDKFSEVITAAESEKFIILHNKCSDIDIDADSAISAPQLDITKQMPINRYYLCERRNTYLTQREIECVKWYVVGKTAEEIAIIYDISKRTVEAHLESVKKKLNCSAKSLLVNKIRAFVNIL